MSNTHITFVLDSSGSMEAIKDDTIGGVNSFFGDQTNEEGTALVSLHEFDSPVDCVCEGYPINGAPRLDADSYVPGGQTALHDAIYTAISGTKTRLSKMESAGKTDNVIVVVLTDRKENASETPQEQIRAEITNCREELGWEFLFIGASQDAALTAEGMGMDADRSLNMVQSGSGAKAAYESTSA